MASISVDEVSFGPGVRRHGYDVESTSQIQYSTRTTNVPPSIEDVQAAFGLASDVGTGFIGMLNPNGDGTSFYFCACDGTNWWTLPMTQLV